MGQLGPGDVVPTTAQRGLKYFVFMGAIVGTMCVCHNYECAFYKNSEHNTSQRIPVVCSHEINVEHASPPIHQ